MTDEEKAFHAGWGACSRSSNHEWGPAPPDNPRIAYMEWKGIKPPRPTVKQEGLMRALGLWDDEAKYLTIKEASKLIDRELIRRREYKKAKARAEEEIGDWDYDDYWGEQPF